MTSLHPVLPLLVAALLSVLARGVLRRALPIFAALVALGALWELPEGARLSIDLVGHEWVLLQADVLGRAFALAFVLYAGLAGLYAWSDREGRSVPWLLLQAAGGSGVVLVGDLFSLYVFWEVLTVSSLFLIWQGGRPRSLGAGFRYAIFHLLGGVCLLAGGLITLAEQGTVLLHEIQPGGVATALILVGFVTNAAVPPLHAWLPDAYPSSTIFGSVILAAFTTKSAVCVLIRVFDGTELLAWAGMAMALYGVFFAVLENDMRRLLAYHIVSQVGYMVCGVGMGTDLAISGSTAHAFAHIFYKGLLLMSVGAVLHATGRGKLTELGGLARPLRWVLLLMFIGGLSISGAPLFNGFVSKSMVVAAAGADHRGAIELLLEVASMGTFLSVGLKMPWYAFFGPESSARVERPVPVSMYLAMWLSAGICLVTGVFPSLIYRLLPHDVGYDPFTAQHTSGMIQLLLGTALGFWILRKKLRTSPTVTLDVDRLYRSPLSALIDVSGAGLEALGGEARRLRSRLQDDAWRRLRFAAERVRELQLANRVAVVVGGFVLLFVLLIVAHLI